MYLHKYQHITLLILVFTNSQYFLSEQNREWPFLNHYDQDHVNKIVSPVGGIGTGTISLGGIGDLRDREIMNRLAKEEWISLWDKYIRKTR